jgi:glycosyltransferase involved in cell wall biosynthesis
MANIYIVYGYIKRYDAIGEYLIAQSNIFQKKGFNVFVCSHSSHLNAEDIPKISYEDLKATATPEDVIIYHYGTFDPGYELICSSKPIKKVLYYHNQTNPEYFDALYKEIAEILRSGLEQIKTAKHYFTRFIANSPYTIQQQKKRKILDDVEWIWLPPIIRNEVITNQKFNQCIDSYCVLGRIVPHKMTHKSIEIFKSILKIKPDSRLVIIGSGEGKYYQDCLNSIESNRAITLYQEIPDDLRANLLLQSGALLNMSAHEGFCLPIIEGVLAGCIPFYGASDWLHDMIDEEMLRVNLNDDYELAAYQIINVMHYKNEVYDNVAKKISILSKHMLSAYQVDTILK